MALTDQMIRASQLDVNLYEEVERDPSQTNNAMLVVVLASVAAGIGTAISQTINPPVAGQSTNVVLGLIGGIVLALISWAIWTGAVYLVGTSILGGTATWGEVLRTVGFANSPGILRILIFIPVIGGLIGLLVAIWTIVTTVIAVRQALDVGTGKAIVASILGAIIAAIVVVILAAIIGIPAAIMGGLATS